MSKALITSPQFQALADECQAALVEAYFAARWGLIEAWHYVGQLVSKFIEENDVSNEEVIQAVAKAIDRSRRSIFYAVKFYRQFPDLSQLKEGKQITYNQIIKKYLTTPEDKDEEECDHKFRCVKCGAMK